MYISLVDVPRLSNDAIPALPLDKPASFSLETSGALGLLDEDDAISAIATAHIYGNRRWLGWYNTPGSFQISKRLGLFARSVSPKSFLSERVHTDPRTLLKLDACNGPKFRATHSGTVMEETGYFATLFMKECAAWESEGTVVPGRKTRPVGITIADLGQVPESVIRPASNRNSAIFFAAIPISASVGTCALCTAAGDLWASSLILVGTVASGLSCLVLGSADFVFTHPVPAQGSPAGDGILGSDNDMVLLKGKEGAVNAITRGMFSLRFSSKSHYNLIRWCSFLFLVQFVTQLLLIPQASLFGQIMFLISLGVSALYNAWLSSDKEKIHRKFLFDQVLKNPKVTRFTLGTRTSAVVFTLLVLQPQDPRGLLNELLDNDTKVWTRWKETILEQLRHQNDRSFHFGGKVGYLEGFTQQEKDLLAMLYEDARAAYDGYKDYLQANSL